MIVHWTFWILILLDFLGSLSYFNFLCTIHDFLLFGPILMITVIISQMTFSLVTKMFGGDISGGIVLWPLGGWSYCGPTTRGGRCGDLLIYVSGPLTFIPQGIGWYALFTLYFKSNYSGITDSVENFSEGQFLREHFFFVLTASAFVLNMTLLVFNLLPLYPLPGGNILITFLLLCGVKEKRTALFVSQSGLFLGLFLAVISGIFFFRSIAFCVVVFGWCLFKNWQLFSLAQNDKLNEHPIFNRHHGGMNKGDVNMGAAPVAEQVVAQPGDIETPAWTTK